MGIPTGRRRPEGASVADESSASGFLGLDSRLVIAGEARWGEERELLKVGNGGVLRQEGASGGPVPSVECRFHLKEQE